MSSLLASHGKKSNLFVVLDEIHVYARANVILCSSVSVYDLYARQWLLDSILSSCSCTYIHREHIQEDAEGFLQAEDESEAYKVKRRK